MKKLILILSLICSTSFGASVTNKVVNTIMITSTNSPIEVGFYLEAGRWMATNANPQAFGHALVNYNNGNPVLGLRNVHPNGLGGFWIQNSLGVDVAFLQWNNNSSNLFLRNGIAAKSLTLANDGGSANTQWQANVITNNGTVVFTGNSVFLGSVSMGSNPGITLSVTNLGPELGSSNVLVYANGSLTNKFTIP